MPVTVLWFRRDLRLQDQPALATARREAGPGGTVVPLFVVDPAVLGPVGPNRRRFLAGCLRELHHDTEGALVMRAGDPVRAVPQLAREVGAQMVVASGDYGPYGARRDRTVGEALAAQGAVLRTEGSPYAVEPGRPRAASGAPFRVFTAYYRAWSHLGWGAPVDSPPPRWGSAPSGTGWAAVEEGLARPGTMGLPDWWEGLPLGPAAQSPPPGESAGRARLEEFVAGPLADYARDRDRMGTDGTSKLSPYLHLGCLHPRTVLEAAGTGRGAERLRSEVAWRDFYADVLWHKPASAHRPLQPFGEHLEWDTGQTARHRFEAWARGRTGYPVVDAAMRQLLAEGWIHNRARMVAASFLVKDLHLDWCLGARWFMWHLVDGDLASNQHGWQWVAGTGTDAAPFYRVFNPHTQQERFDPDGSYVRRYIPELGPPGPGGRHIGWGALPSPAGAYPGPIVDHAAERQEALDRFNRARRAVSAAGAGRALR